MPQLYKKKLDQNAFVQMVPVWPVSADAGNQSFWSSISTWEWVMITGILGSFLLVVRFLVKYWSFRHIKNHAELISNDGAKIYKLNEHVMPFSFGNAIFINPAMHDEQEIREIIRHEFAHVKQVHTIDVLWSELLCIFCWYNPLVWMIQKSIRQNLEFLADNRVLQHGVDKKQYQYMLLKVLGNSQFAFVSHFNFQSLKNRIAMMNTIQSAKVHLVKFMFLLPLMAVLLLAFRKEMKSQKQNVNNGPAGTFDNLGKNNHDSLIGNINLLKNTAVATYHIQSIKDTTPVKIDRIRDSMTENLLDRIKSNYGGAEPLFILDDEPISANVLRNISPKNIRSISILKDASATALYGPKGANGVMLITTKNADPEKDPTPVRMRGRISGIQIDSIQRNEIVVVGRPAKKTDSAGRIKDVVVIGYGVKDKDSVGNIKLGSARSTGVNPLVIVDGKELQKKEIAKINKDAITSIDVIKSEDGTARYGDKGKNGVIVIKTKGEAKVQAAMGEGTVKIVGDTLEIHPNK